MPAYLMRKGKSIMDAENIKSTVSKTGLKIKEFLTGRFLKFLKNYKRFKDLPKKSKIKHIAFPIVIVLIIAIAANAGGGSTNGLTDEQANAVIVCSVLPSDLQSAASFGAVQNVYFGSLADYYNITSVEKDKEDDGDLEITVYLDYQTSSGNTSSGTLVFDYNEDSNSAELTGGTALSDFQNWGIYYCN